MEIRAALQMPTKPLGGVSSKKAGKKNKCGLVLLKPQLSEPGFPGMLQAASKAHCGKLPDVHGKPHRELPRKEAFRPGLM